MERKYKMIEEIDQNTFFVVDEISTMHGDNEKTAIIDTLMFNINKEGKVISPIYSTLASGWILYDVNCKTFDYYTFVENRKDHLKALEETNIQAVKTLKKIKTIKA